eukprot:14384708-Alexandrium_andersonii.AAC.1
MPSVAVTVAVFVLPVCRYALCLGLPQLLLFLLLSVPGQGAGARCLILPCSCLGAFRGKSKIPTDCGGSGS